MKALDEIYYNIVDNAGEIPTSMGVRDLLSRIVHNYGLLTAAYFAASPPGLTDDIPYFAVARSEEWVERCASEDHARLGAILREGFSSVLPIDWRDLDSHGAKLKDFFAQTAHFRSGRQGLTVPIHGLRGERALFTVTSDADDDEWDLTLRGFKRDFQALAYHVHNAVLRTTVAKHQEVHLSPREMECLQWVAQGKTVAETATILSISDRTVRFYLDLARAKLKASNVTHAVATAIKMNLFFGRR